MDARRGLTARRALIVSVVMAALFAMLTPFGNGAAGALGVPPSPLPAPGVGSELIGCAQAAVRASVTVSSHLDPTCTYTGGFDITASDVVLDCQGALIANLAASGEGIRVASPSGTSMSGIRVRNCRVQGFLNSFEVIRTGFHDLAAGHEFDQTLTDVVAEDSEFFDSRGAGVFINGYVSGVTLRNLDIHDAGSTGVYLEAGSKESTVVGNAIHDNGFSQAGPAGQLVSLGGNQFRYWGTGREGLAIDGSWDNTIADNTFTGNSAGSIFVYTNCGEDQSNPSRWFERRYGADRNLIEGNSFVGGLTGVWVGSRMGENTYPMDCSQAAYVDEPLKRIVRDRAADTIVQGNAFSDVTYGVRVEDDRTTVSGNTFGGSDPTHHAVIVGTRVRTAVLAEPVSGTVVTGNTASIVGNPYPYRWVHGHTGTTFTANTALGRNIKLCQGPQLPFNAFIFALKIVSEPVGSPVTPTPDLTAPTIGALATCDPGVARSVTAAPVNGGARVSWQAPTTDGGSPITSYQVTPFIKYTAVASKAQTIPAPVTTATFSTLVNGTAYGYRIQAITAVGAGPMVLSPAVIAGTPGAMTGIYARPGVRDATTTGSLIISADRPAENGAPLTSWSASCVSTNGGVTRTASVAITGAGMPALEVLLLTTGKSYACTVRASNARGIGAAAKSATIIVGAPGPPTPLTIIKVAPGALTVTFKAARANGSPITVYVTSCTSTNGGVARGKLGGSPTTITGLTAGKTYQCVVYGHNARGNGIPASFPLITV